MSGTAAHQAEDAAWRPKSNPWLIAVVVTLAAFMEILDTTIVNVSLPHIAGSVSASYDDATWTLTSYLVANGIVLPISGFIGRVIGRKRYFLICIAGFVVCSFLCGTATSLGQMVVFRLMQGFFGGGLQPNQQAIILDTFEPKKRGAAFGVVAIAVIFAPAIGPTLGGILTDSYSWRWIFWINIPVGMFAFFAVMTMVEDPPWVKRDKARVGDTDWIGLTLIALGIGCLQVMMDRGEDEDWFSSGFIVMMAAFAAVGIIGAIVWLTTTDKPIVRLSVFKDRNFAIGTVMITGVGAVLYSGAVLVPQLAQQQLGYTATWAGLILSPGAVAIVVLIPLVGKFLLPNVQTRLLIAFGFLLIGLSYFYSSLIVVPTINFGNLVVARIFQVLGLAFLFVPVSTISYTTLPRSLNNDASSLFVMLRNIAGSIGISLATAGVTERTQTHMAYLQHYMTPLWAPYAQLQQQLRGAMTSLGYVSGQISQLLPAQINEMFIKQASMLAYRDLFVYCGVAAFCVIPLAFLFSPSKGGGRGGGGH
ncbi:DHA2 family efflux MFS transporter permease subunit [Acidisoma silvae]|uniref:DHA2 family efflux MFS transporter permease subunit n=1 Tax=Acidisoma silvae TaxID=2802396 RepID=A0A963YU01_9PROT|nr:DHA2 family efflux MFS transporter permease subunit [Acidisoma silvae]MCB8876522.1 DHA2 family efflux MFS transporter permease subunit [Acidisoma silvae]